MVFSGSNAHRWAVCTCVQLAEAAMESRDAVGVISPSETCSRTSRDVIRESRGEGRVMEERRLITRYNAPCFLKQYPSFRPHCRTARSFQQCPRILFCRVTGPLEMSPLYRLWMVAIFQEYPRYLAKRFSWRVHVNSIQWSVVFQRKPPLQPLYHMSLKAPFRVLSKDLLRGLKRCGCQGQWPLHPLKKPLDQDQ